MNKRFILMLGPALACACGPALCDDLHVVVTNVIPGKGMVRAALYDGAPTFLIKPRAAADAAGDKEKVELVFRGVPKGAYAVSAYQDTNGNKKLDSNSYGIPSEPYGMSRNAAGRSGPPAFDDAKVDVDAAGWTITVTLRK